MRESFFTSRKPVGSIVLDQLGEVHFLAPTLRQLAEFNALTLISMVKALAYLILVLSADKDGKRIFQDDDKDRIEELDSTIAIPLGNAIAKFIGHEFAEEEVEKKRTDSEPTAS